MDKQKEDIGYKAINIYHFINALKELIKKTNDGVNSMIDLKSILKQHPNCLNSRASFKSVLMDKYPSEKRTVNILTIMFECGIVHKIKGKQILTDNDFQALQLQLENDYGILSRYSDESIRIWANAFDVTVSYKPQTSPIVHRPIVHAPVVEKVIVEGTKSDYKTKTENGVITITKFIGFDEKKIVVPNQIDGVAVKFIGDNAFEKCSGIEQIVISEGITEIHNGVFYGCSSLKDVVLPTTLLKIGKVVRELPSFSWKEDDHSGVFEGSAIKTINLPVGLNYIGRRAFYNCNQLERIDLPNGIKTIDCRTFYGCKSLKQVLLPDNLKEIKKSAFAYCGIESIDIPPSVTEIDCYAFQGCDNFKKITLHEGLLKIGSQAFENCKLLCSITIPRSVTTIGENVFDITGWYQPSDLRRKGWSTRNKNSNLTISCYAGTCGLDFARKEGYKVQNAAK